MQRKSRLWMSESGFTSIGQGRGLVLKRNLLVHTCRRSYPAESTGSHPNSEVKLLRDRLAVHAGQILMTSFIQHTKGRRLVVVYPTLSA